MTWAKVDDSFHSHPKVRAAWYRCATAVGLQVMAISYAADHETDGLVPGWFMEGLLPKAKERKLVVSTLLDLVMLEESGADFEVHDFLDYNPSKADMAARREREAERKRKARASG
jgi:hypothetical protein